jgi:RNA polymerase sigma factor (sigma-70 family)
VRAVQDAEDAFQATFLVLVRKAKSIRTRELLANWLYGVACRTARRARIAAVRQQAREKQVMRLPELATPGREPWDDVRELIDVELDRLPHKYRVTVVLCDLEGKTHQEAARLLGWPVGSVSGRLVRARDLLARRLARRGLPLGAGALAVGLAQEVTAAPPAAAVSATVKAGALVLAGEGASVMSPAVWALTKGVVRAMWWSKIKVVAVLSLAAFLCGGVALLSQSAPQAGQPGAATQAKGEKPDPAPQDKGGTKDNKPVDEKPVQEPKGTSLPDPGPFGKVTAGWQLGAKLNNVSSVAGGVVLLTVTLKNVSKQSLKYGESNPGFDYFWGITVKDANGQPVPKTKFGAQWEGLNEIFKYVQRTVKPGYQVVTILNLSRNFDLSMPGKYTITVKHPYATKASGGDVEVVANPVQLEITPADRPSITVDDALRAKIKEPEGKFGAGLSAAGIGPIGKDFQKRIKELEGKAVLDLIGEDNIKGIQLFHPAPGDAKGKGHIHEAEFVNALRTGKFVKRDTIEYALKTCSECVVETPQGNYRLGIYYEPVAYLVLPNGESYWFFYGENIKYSC